jgi:hypothetical protein
MPSGPDGAPVIATRLLCAGALSFATFVACAQDKNPAAAIVGTWKVVAYEDRTEGQPVKYQYGEKPRGQLTYDATGHMSIQLMKVPHPKIASGDEEKATPAEKAALYDAYAAYFGTYTVDAKRSVVIHHVEGDLYDVFIGTDQERPFELQGDRLVLRPKWTVDGKQWTGLRVFERVK